MIAEYIYEVVPIVITMLLAIWSRKIDFLIAYISVQVQYVTRLRKRYLADLENETAW